MSRFHWLLKGPLALVAVFISARTKRWLTWLKRVFIIALVLWWGSSNFLYLDLRAGCTITIAPSFLNFNGKTIIEALTILKNESQKDYSDTCYLIRHISTNLPPSGCSVIGGGCFWPEKPDTIYIQVAKNQHALTSSVIAHEVCHARQHTEGRRGSEPECYAVGDTIIQRVTSLP